MNGTITNAPHPHMQIVASSRLCNIFPVRGRASAQARISTLQQLCLPAFQFAPLEPTLHIAAKALPQHEQEAQPLHLKLLKACQVLWGFSLNSFSVKHHS